MAWVRIHDGAMTHPKLVGLSDKAFRFWVWCLSYAQQHLTDGLIPVSAIKRQQAVHFGHARIRDKVMHELQQKSLISPEEVPTGQQYKVHDFLDWNDSRELVRSRQAAAKQRLAEWRAKHGRPQPPQRNSVSPPVETDLKRLPKPNLTKVLLPTVAVAEGRAPTAPIETRSKQVIFPGQRLTVFGWMFDECCHLLGDHVEQFELDVWFNDLDRRLVRDNLALAKEDRAEWLRRELVAEAQRRGLPLKFVETRPTDDQMWADMARKGPSKRP